MRSILDTLADLASRAADQPAVERMLAATERWPDGELVKHQLAKLGSLIEHARRTVPYYASLPATPLAGWTLDRLADVPLLDREVVRLRPEELTSRAPPPGHDVVREANSSGSTGRHVTVKVDRASAAVSSALALRTHRSYGRDLTLKAAAIRAVADDDDTPRRTDLVWSASVRSGRAVLLDAHTPAREQLAWLVREAPAYLAVYPSIAEALLTRAELDGVRLPSLSDVGTFGEVVTPELREACRRVWDVPLYDAYSAVETGFIAVQCPAAERYHVQSENVLVEILAEDGSHAAPGESGRVVLTVLHGYAMPLIRYEIGDYAVVGEPCACGRTLPVINRILGRYRNMMRLSSGDVLWPRYASVVLGKLFPLRQFRLVQKSLTELVLEVVVDRPMTFDEEQRLRRMILETVRHPFELALARVDSIPRSPGGKFEDFVCEISSRSGC